MAASKGGGVRKEEIQLWGTNTLMRTVKKPHNIKLREKETTFVKSQLENVRIHLELNTRAHFKVVTLYKP